MNSGDYLCPIGESDFFNPKDPTYKWRGNLPHIEQAGKIYFVTIRLSDSLPVNCVLILRQKFEDLKRDDHSRRLSAEDQNFMRKLGAAIDKYLDKGYGKCYFRYELIRNELIKTLMENNTKDYLLYDYIIMPNHIHLLIKPSSGTTLKRIISGIKRKSTFRINKLLASNESLWQRDYFDRIIRNINELYLIRQYIKENSRNLHPTEYYLYSLG